MSRIRLLLIYNILLVERVRREEGEKEIEERRSWGGGDEENTKRKKGKAETKDLSQQLANFVSEAPDNKYLRVYSPLASI